MEKERKVIYNDTEEKTEKEREGRKGKRYNCLVAQPEQESKAYTLASVPDRRRERIMPLTSKIGK